MEIYCAEIYYTLTICSHLGKEAMGVWAWSEQGETSPYSTCVQHGLSCGEGLGDHHDKGSFRLQTI